MFKKSLLATALVVACSGASATTTVNDVTAIDYATELFGTSDLVLSGTGVDVDVAVTDLVSDGATASFTFTLSNGTFGANPTLAFDTTAGTGDAGVSLTSGGVGSNSATFTVVVTDVFDGDEVFTLNVPSLSGVTTLSDADGEVTISLAVDNTNIVAVGFDETVAFQSDPAADALATASTGIELSVTGTTPQIDVSDQTQFSGAVDNVDLFTTIDLAPVAANIESEDGATDFDIAAADSATITLTGSFAENAEVCVALAAATDCSAEVGTSVVTTSTATITLTGTEVGTVGGAGHDILYVVDGAATIPVSDIQISSTVTYDDADYAGTVTYDSAEEAALSLAGLTALDESTRINIITRPGASDETFIRVTNKDSASAEIYINLTTQDGSASAFGRLGTIASGATDVYDSQEIADAVGLETWTGRGNALLSVSTAASDAGDIVIVPLIRANGVLTNQAAASIEP